MGILEILKHKLIGDVASEIKEQADTSMSLLKDGYKEMKSRSDETAELIQAVKEDIRNIRTAEQNKHQQLAFVKLKMQVDLLREPSGAFIEELCLRMCNIQQLLNKLYDISCDCKSVCVITSTLGDFMGEKDGWEVIHSIADWKKEERYDQLMILNPKDVYEFLGRNPLYENVGNLKEELVFLMPCIDEDGFQVIWDEGFGEVETDGQVYYRWYIGNGRMGKIMIYNVYGCLKPVRLLFESYAANPDARIVIQCGDYCRILDFKLCEHEFCMETILVPGKNEIEIAFCGEICNLSETELRQCQFTVTNFRIEDLEKRTVFSGRQVYQRQCHSCYSGYILPERFIRNALHENGCFEIEKFLCKADGIDWIDTTRAYVSYGGYYTLREEKRRKGQETGLALYIARRKGRPADAG